MDQITYADFEKVDIRVGTIRAAQPLEGARKPAFRLDRANNARWALAHLPVNTSLSGTLFFSTCWCIRDVVHLDSRVHAANRNHLTYIGGQYGEES